MAFVPPSQDEAQRPTGAQVNQIPQQTPISAGGAGVSGASKAANTPGQNVPAQPSAQLQSYLNANQPQAVQFAGQVAGQVGQNVQTAANAIQPAVNQFAQSIYTVPTDAAVNQQVETSPSGLTDQQKSIYQSELGASAKSPNVADTFETTQPYQDLTQNIQKTVDQANLWNQGNNIPALSSAIQPFEKSGETSGNTKLDALLLSQVPGAYNQIKQATAPAKNLQGQLATGTDQANTAMRDAIAKNTATTQAANQSAQTYATNLSKYLQDAMGNAQKTSGDTNAKILSDLKANTLTPEEQTILSANIPKYPVLQNASPWDILSGDMANATKAGVPVDLSQYLKQTPADISVYNAATPQQYSDIAMLQSLLGPNAPGFPISSATADQAGKIPTPESLNNFDWLGADTQAVTNYSNWLAQNPQPYTPPANALPPPENVAPWYPGSPTPPPAAPVPNPNPPKYYIPLA